MKLICLSSSGTENGSVVFWLRLLQKRVRPERLLWPDENGCFGEGMKDKEGSPGWKDVLEMWTQAQGWTLCVVEERMGQRRGILKKSWREGL